MAIHGQDREAQRRRDYQMSELMAQGERLRDVEDRLKGVLRRLDELEASLVSQPSWTDERFGIWGSTSA